MCRWIRILFSLFFHIFEFQFLLCSFRIRKICLFFVSEELMYETFFRAFYIVFFWKTFSFCFSISEVHYQILKRTIVWRIEKRVYLYRESKFKVKKIFFFFREKPSLLIKHIISSVRINNWFLNYRKAYEWNQNLFDSLLEIECNQKKELKNSKFQTKKVTTQKKKLYKNKEIQILKAKKHLRNIKKL